MAVLSDRRRPLLERPPQEVTALRLKVWLLGAFILLLFSILGIQLLRLQIFQHEQFEVRATTNRLRVINAPAVRGLIYARDGTPLVENIPGFAVTIVPADVPEGQERAVARDLAALLQIPAYQIETGILEGRRSLDPFLPVVIDGDADADLAFRVAAQRADLPGVQVEAVANRAYPQGPLIAHLLGYIGPITAQEFEVLRTDRYRLADRVGQTGIEAAYESQLRGVPGRQQVEIDAAGRELRTLASELPTPGQGLVLAVDLDLQREVQRILQESMAGARFATAVVVDVHTGEILAMVSLPTYDNNIFAGEISQAELDALFTDAGRPLVNHAIADQFAPGSAFKVVTGTAALQEGIVDERTTIRSLGAIEVQNELDPRVTYTFKDTTAGDFSFIRGLAQSSNVYFFYLAGGSPFRRPVPEELLTPQQLAEQQALIDAGVIGGAQDFVGLGAERAGGLDPYVRRGGSRAGIDLAGEATGFVPDPEWKLRTFGESWGQGDSYNFGIGQGFLAVTPLQMAMITAAIANGGDLLEPRIVREVLDVDGNADEPFQPRVRRRLDVDPGVLALIRDGRARAVLGGTAGNAWFPELQVAGKTGTAEFGESTAFRDLFRTHGWFIGFRPLRRPADRGRRLPRNWAPVT